MAPEYLIRATYISETKSNVNSTDENSDISIVDKIDMMVKRSGYKKMLIKKINIRFTI